MPPFTIVQKILVDLVVQIFYEFVCCSIYSLMARLQGLWNLRIPQPHMIHKKTSFTTYPRQILLVVLVGLLLPLVRIFRCTPPLWCSECTYTEMFILSRLPFGLCSEDLILKSNDIMKLILNMYYVATSSRLKDLETTEKHRWPHGLILKSPGAIGVRIREGIEG